MLPLPESFALENLEGAPPKKFSAVPPLKNPGRKPAYLKYLAIYFKYV